MLCSLKLNIEYHKGKLVLFILEPHYLGLSWVPLTSYLQSIIDLKFFMIYNLLHVWRYH